MYAKVNVFDQCKDISSCRESEQREGFFSGIEDDDTSTSSTGNENPSEEVNVQADQKSPYMQENWSNIIAQSQNGGVG